MLIVGIKDTKTASFVNVLAVASVENYKNMLMQDMNKPDSHLFKYAHDYEVYTMGEMDGSGVLTSNIEFVTQLQVIKFEVQKSHLAFYQDQVKELTSKLGVLNESK